MSLRVVASAPRDHAPAWSRALGRSASMPVNLTRAKRTTMPAGYPRGRLRRPQHLAPLAGDPGEPNVSGFFRMARVDRALEHGDENKATDRIGRISQDRCRASKPADSAEQRTHN